MGFVVGATFKNRLDSMGMDRSELEKLNFTGDKGFVPYTFKDTKYNVEYKRSGNDIELLGISAYFQELDSRDTGLWDLREGEGTVASVPAQGFLGGGAPTVISFD